MKKKVVKTIAKITTNFFILKVQRILLSNKKIEVELRSKTVDGIYFNIVEENGENPKKENTKIFQDSKVVQAVIANFSFKIVFKVRVKINIENNKVIVANITVRKQNVLLIFHSKKVVNLPVISNKKRF